MGVRELGRDSVEGVTAVLCESFYDYPVMRFVLRDAAEAYADQLETLIGFFVMARVLRGETLLGIGPEQDPDGVALVSRPEVKSPPELGALREAVWAELGHASRERYEAFGAACAPFHMDLPQIHLNMVGVRRRARGSGLGRRLIEHVHEMSMHDAGSVGVSLTTEDPGNIPLYERFGYEVVGEGEVSPELTTWGFFRLDSDHR